MQTIKRDCPRCGKKNGVFVLNDDNVYSCDICGYEIESDEKPIVKNEAVVSQSSEDARLDLIDQLKKSVVIVRVEYDNDRIASGTGWVGRENIIITNAHVIVPSDKTAKIVNVSCEFNEEAGLKNSKYLMEVLYLSEVEDIAILKPIKKILPEQIPVLSIKKEDTRMGEDVFTIGNPLHYKWTFSEGKVANPSYKGRGSKRLFDVLQTSIILNHGNSGGPVFNNKGQVVGMTTYSELEPDTNKVILETGDGVLIGNLSTSSEIKGFSFSVKSEAILFALNTIKNK